MRRGPFIAMSVVLDALLVNVAIVASFFIRFGGTLPEFNFEPYLILAPFITVIYLGCGYVYGLYEPERTEHTWAIVRAVMSSVTLGVALTTALLFFAGPGFFSFSRLVIIISWVLQGLVLTAWRLIFLSVSSITWPEQRIVIIGTDELAVELASEFDARKRWGYRVIGLVATEQDAKSGGDERASQGRSSMRSVGGFPVLGCVDDIARIVHSEGVHRVVVVSPVTLRDLIERLTLADEMDVRVDVVPELYEIFIGTIDSLVADIPLMEITRTGVPPWSIVIKRVVDIVGALVLIVLLSPVFLLTSLAILLSMGWPILYSQERVGKDLHTFNLHKFRTMVREAERDTGPVLAAHDDSRITPLGRVLRTYRIDELPQLIDILLGKMSFVGPRPERPFFVERHLREIPGYRERFKIAPGVTGLAQVSGGYATTAERKLKYDLIYIYHQNLLMDLQIIIETLRVVLTGRGAR